MAPDSSVLYIALIGMVAVGIMFVLEVRRWKTMARLITRRQRILRVVLICMIEFLFVMILIGPWVMAEKHVAIQLLYYVICLLVGFVVMILAVVDLRAVVRGYAAVNRSLLSGLGDDDRPENN